jgi:hypothetical protein
MYWLALSTIPATILHRIRQLTYGFLWSSGKKKKNIHLCNWTLIARPKSLGGWGLRNIPCFGRALVENILWRALMHDGLWHRVLKSKYFLGYSVDNWLCFFCSSRAKGSQSWLHLLKFSHIILHWITWRPGSGHNIMVGCDCILGMGESTILSEELIRIINRQGIHHLYQAAENNRAGTSTSIWYSRVALNLLGQHLIEWELFRRDLIKSGVQLHDLPEALIWTGGDKTGITSVKKIYLAVEKKKWTHTISG